MVNIVIFGTSGVILRFMEVTGNTLNVTYK